MYQGFMEQNDEVIIVEDDKAFRRANVNNIEEILKTEEYIAKLERLAKSNLEDDKEFSKLLDKFSNKPSTVILYVILTILVVLAAIVSGNIMISKGLDFSYLCLLFPIPFALAIKTLYVITNVIELKQVQKYCNLFNNYVTENLEKQKEYLQKLQQESVKVERKTDYKNISIKEKLEELKNALDVYRSLIVNESKYEKYYDNNELEEKLKEKNYNEEGIKLVRNYFNERSDLR